MPTLRPQAGPQELWLKSSADIAVYGGSAGGGKTWALLMEPLRHIKNPHFGAVIFRRTSPQITNEGGLWDEASKIYPQIGAVPRVGDLEWHFPRGSKLAFRHLQHESNKFDWQGSQIPLLGFDELTHFTETQFFYLLSRNRSTCGVRPYVRATVNPDAGSWVKRFLAPWVDRTYADPAKSGEIRWFVRHKGELIWARDPAELKARFPRLMPKSVTFVRASVYDNKILLAVNPEYLGNLMALPDVERRRLLDGDWDVKREGLVYPELPACIVPDETLVLPAGNHFGGIDFGFNNPFAAPAAVLDRDDVLWVYWLRYLSRRTLPQHSEALLRPEGGITWYADPARPDDIAELQLADHVVVPCVHRGPKPIKSGIDRVSERIRAGKLRVSSACGDLITEAGLYCYDEKKRSEEPIDADNHALDALRYMIVGIDRHRAIPYTPPDRSDEVAWAEALARRQLEEAYHDLDADHWWEGA
jgi:hypothetical protein